MNRLNLKIIHPDEIERLEYINKGASGYVYKAKYNNQNIIYKCFNLNRYSDTDSLLEDVTHECKNYAHLRNTKYCCKLIGICYSKNDICMLLKDYNVSGDLYDYLNQEKFWNQLETKRKLRKNEYFYCYKQSQWIYNQNRQMKIKLTQANLIIG